MINLSIERCVSKSGNSYIALKQDFGYRKAVVCVGNDCAEWLGLSPADFATFADHLDNGDSIRLSPENIYSALGEYKPIKLGGKNT